MTAIMLNNKNTDEEKSIQKCHAQSQKIRNLQAEIHQNPKTDERQKGSNHLRNR